ncbi:MAG: MBL fold metallo-hydrolase [Candidatus Altiarchaeales archaeon]|nr:MBL fold metallo-hydrolase [Candidatus Altiarchaeales archaeon]
MKVDYVAFDSMGVKSMCFRVKTQDLTVTVDPGAAIETNSFPLPLKEREKLVAGYHKKIKNSCRRSDLIVITHYHYDHYTPEKSMYEGKQLLIKDPRKYIKKSQRARAGKLLSMVEGAPEGVETADGRKFRFGDTSVEFSDALWHGKRGTHLGWVLMVNIDDGESNLLYTSDLCGVYLREYADLIIDRNPDILIMDGFPSYLLGYVVSYRGLKNALENTIRIIENTDSDYYVIDHHLLRDYRFREIYYEVYRRAEELGKRILTAAEVEGKKPAVLAGFKRYGPTRWKKWDNITFEGINEKYL